MQRESLHCGELIKRLNDILGRCSNEELRADDMTSSQVKMLTGCGKYLENYVKAEFGIKCRSIELNLPQRCSSLLASATDIDEAEKAGKAAVVAALDGETGKMITFERDDTNGYEINYGLADVNDICNKEKKFPAEWITADGTDISDEYIKYVRPLIQGTNIAEYSDGVPVHLKPAYYR